MFKLVKLSDIFYIKYGVNLELNKLKICDKNHVNAIPFVSRTSKSNGIDTYVENYIIILIQRIQFLLLEAVVFYQLFIKITNITVEEIYIT
jgi:hypothetical protein